VRCERDDQHERYERGIRRGVLPGKHAELLCLFVMQIRLSQVLVCIFCNIAFARVPNANEAKERNLITERTMAGLQAARARGRKGGRPRLNPAVSKVAMAKKLYADHTNSIREICRTLHISRATLYRYLKAT
jgi:predicted transcriptional regulator YheO